MINCFSIPNTGGCVVGDPSAGQSGPCGEMAGPPVLTSPASEASEAKTAVDV